MKFHKKKLRDNHLDKYTCIQSQNHEKFFDPSLYLQNNLFLIDAKILPESLKTYVWKSNAICHRSVTWKGYYLKGNSPQDDANTRWKTIITQENGCMCKGDIVKLGSDYHRCTCRYRLAISCFYTSLWFTTYQFVP